MQHRHLNHEDFTPAAIDDIITRGRWQDWADVRAAVLADRSLMEVVERVCLQYVGAPKPSAIISG